MLEVIFAMVSKIVELSGVTVHDLGIVDTIFDSILDLLAR